MDFVNVVLFGAIIGALADLLYPGSYKRLLGPIILGSIGAVCGSILAALVFNPAANIAPAFPELFIIFTGAFLTVFLSKAFKRFES
jgi:uncharacterized membrane protein YeaQ/YmgE (transglycosylase-associated protein family)